MNPALAKAGLRRFRFHDLRHTFGSLLIQDGASLAYVKDPMGHSSIQFTVDIYRHLVPSANIACVDCLDTETSLDQSAPGTHQAREGLEQQHLGIPKIILVGSRRPRCRRLRGRMFTCGPSRSGIVYSTADRDISQAENVQTDSSRNRKPTRAAVSASSSVGSAKNNCRSSPRTGASTDRGSRKGAQCRTGE